MSGALAWQLRRLGAGAAASLLAAAAGRPPCALAALAAWWRGQHTAATFQRTDAAAPLEERRRQHVRQHTVTAADAVGCIAPGPHRILIGSGAAEPGLLVDALMARTAELSGSEIVHLLTLGAAPYVEEPHW